MEMNEREHHIKVLEKMFYVMEKLENGVILPTSEVKTALAYAISSLKTDLKYDFLYEGEDVYTKDDLVAILEDLKQDFIAEAYGIEMDCTDYVVNVADIDKVIYQKINSLKEQTK